MTDSEFEALMLLKKAFADKAVDPPKHGENRTYDIISIESKDEFFLDIDRRGRIELSKFKLQNRYAITKMPLVRIDIDSPPHTNPDMTTTSRNHIHIFRESDYETGNLVWAYDLENFEKIRFDKNNIVFIDILLSFCEYCNIDIENIQSVL